MTAVADRLEGVVRPWSVGVGAALVGEAAYVVVAADTLVNRPSPDLRVVLTLPGLAVGAIGLLHIGLIVGAVLRSHGARPTLAVRPWSVVLAASLLFVYEAAGLAAGMYAMISPAVEDIGGLFTLYGLIAGLLGIVYLVLTVPALLGRRRGRIALLVLTALVVAYVVQLAVVSGVSSPGLSLTVVVIALPPSAATALLFLPASRPYFARPAR